MYDEPRDSRQRYTKQCLFDSFISDLEKRSVSEITVSEISERAGVSRKTFYKYYSDQFALLKAMQDDLFIGLQMHLQNLPPNVFDIVPALISFVDDHRVLIKAAFENRSEGNFIDRTVAYLYEAYHPAWEEANPGLPKKDVEFLFHFVASGMVGVISLWLFENPEMKPAEVAQKAEFLMKLSGPTL